MTAKKQPNRLTRPTAGAAAALRWKLFEQTPVFTRRWDQLGLTDDDLRHLEDTLLKHPDAGDTMAGTGGMRKLRLAPLGSGRGKSGGCRLCYKHFKEFGRILLLIVYSKSEAADLSDAARKHCRALIAEAEALLRSKAEDDEHARPRA